MSENITVPNIYLDINDDALREILGLESLNHTDAILAEILGESKESKSKTKETAKKKTTTKKKSTSKKKTTRVLTMKRTK